MIFLEFGTDNAGLAILLAVIFYIIWGIIDSDSLVEHLTKNNLKHGERGARWAKNRRRRLKKRAKELEFLRRVKTPNVDDKYIYIMVSGGLFKVGISNNVLYRRKSIEKKLSRGVGILYIGSVNFGRTIDKEQIIIKELEEFNVPVHYNDGTISREWFDCPIETLVDKVSEYADLVKYG